MGWSRPWQIAIATLLAALAAFESRYRGDFDIYLSASTELFQNGQNVYVIFFHEAYHYFYNITFLILLQPLTWLPVWLATLLWNLLGLALSWRLLVMIFRLIPQDWLSPGQQRGWSLLVFVLIFSVWHKNLHVGQVTLVMTWAMWQSWIWFRDGKAWLGGILLAFFISLKLMPLVLIPYLAWRGKWRGILTTVIAMSALICLPLLVLEQYNYEILLEDRWALLNPGNEENVLDVAERSFHSLTTLLSTLLVADARGMYTEEIPRHVADIPLSALAIVIRTVQVMFVAATFWFIGRPWFRGKISSMQEWHGLGYIFLATPLIFPHQQHYAFFMALPAMAWVALYVIRSWNNPEMSKQRWLWAGLLLLVFAGFNSHFLLGTFNWFYNHFKTLTWAALVLVWMYAFLTPRRLGYLPSSD